MPSLPSLIVFLTIFFCLSNAFTIIVEDLLDDNSDYSAEHIAFLAPEDENPNAVKSTRSHGERPTVFPDNKLDCFDPSFQKYYKTVGPCCSPDIIFIIDITDIRGFSRLECAKYVSKFMVAVVQRVAPKPCDKVRVALVEYGTKGRIVFDFSKFTSINLIKYILSSYIPGSSLGRHSYALAGFTGARMILNDPTRGRRKDSAAFVIWMTHSMPYRNRKLKSFVDKNIKHHAYIIVIGIGHRLQIDDIKQVATTEKYFFHKNRPSLMFELPSLLQYNFCPVLLTTTTTMTTQPTTTTPTTTTTTPTTTTTTTTITTTTTMTTTTTPTTTTTTPTTTTTSTTTTTTPTTTTTSPITKLLFSTPETQPLPTTPSGHNELCYQCRGRRNHKDLYADPSDCHKYIQCFYYNGTYAVGISRVCPVGTFWHDPVLQCMPEGEVPCVDLCLSDDAVHAKGCYAGIGCRQYFVCAGTASYGFCCPQGSRFNESLCSCDEGLACLDSCERPSPEVATTKKPSVIVNSTVCQDSFGTLIAISTAPGETNVYYLLDEFGQATEKRYCPSTVSFDLTECSCSLYTGVTAAFLPVKRMAALWLPLDNDYKDHSANNFLTSLYDGASLDGSAYAHGRGSLAINGGYLSIPGLKNYDVRGSVSWCAFFRCQSGLGFTCASSGGILSNNKNVGASEYSIIMAVQNTNRFIARLNFWHPLSTLIASASIASMPQNGWNHVCASYCSESNAARVYLNGALAYEDIVIGELSIAHCPYVVGHDQFYGHFDGNIDDVLITPFCMTGQERSAHLSGNRAYLQSQGFF